MDEAIKVQTLEDLHMGIDSICIFLVVAGFLGSATRQI